MIPATAAEVPAPRIRSIRVTGSLVLIALAILIALDPSWNQRLPAAGFDAYQLITPRQVETLPVTVVEIDDKSLSALGRWPWPRTLLAQLIDDINRNGPAVIGIDIFMPEADPLSPDRLVGRSKGEPPRRYEELAALPSNDKILAQSLAATRSVLAIVGTPNATGMPLRVAPFVIQQARAAAGSPVVALPTVKRFAGALTSVDELNRAASGGGLISVDSAGGAIRRIPLVANIDGTLVPAFAVEMLRVAMGAPSWRLVVSGSSVNGIAVGKAFIPTEGDGGVRIYYSPRNAGRFVSAVDVLQGNVDPARIRGQLVLVGVTGIGLGDYHYTPLAEAMPGSEIHAQLLENMLDRTLLIRPTWAPALEATLFLLLGALLVWATPTWKSGHAALLAAGCLAAPVAVGYGAFRSFRLVLDAATPGVALLLLFGILLLLTLAEATRQKKTLERAMHAERERSARMVGELEAARRVQVAFLPDVDQFRNDPRIDLAAAMMPAREVGGDLYDFFRLDDRRLFFLVGDVAGKGLSASIFMAVSKALYKSATLRAAAADLGALMSEANAEVSRDNPQMLFVTAFAGVLDLDTGDLTYCNAGHENPFLVAPTDASVRRLEDGGGPPLCAVEAFAYRGVQDRMRPGELLCVISDGVTEAQSLAGDLYGSGRVRDTLRGVLRGSVTTASAFVDALCGDVESFAAGVEPADDLTVLVLRWLGPGASAPIGGPAGA